MTRPGHHNGLFARMIAATVVACLGSVVAGHAQSQDPVLATSRIIITGGGITIRPAHHVVPRNIATAIETVLGIPGDTSGGTNGQTAELAAAFPAGAIMFGELVGPSLGAPVTLTTRPGESFRIQPLAIAGLHFLRNIRLVSGGATLLAAQPDAVTIEVIDRVLVSQVTSRPLSAEEIRNRGIVIDQTNYQAVSFSAAFGFQGREVNISFPMIVPSRGDTTLAPAVQPLELPRLLPTTTPAPSVDLPRLVEAFQTSNVSIGGLLLRVEDEEIERAFSIPALSGVIVIPGNIAYLNQFFSILTLVSNAAPGYSNLTAHDVRAEIVLPPGTDTVAGSGDDPLRMARVGSPPAEQSHVLPVTIAGPDGRLGTADDILVIAPQLSGNAEHLVEGLREGVHTIEIKITAMLHGLPIGPVAISGRVLGTVEVRNPTFALTLSHPATVTAGEEYDLLVTVTNTSASPANLASVNLLPRSISGATLLSGQSVQIETIAPGDSETVSFRLLSQTTGTVTATSFSSEGIPGRFELRSAVGALGIPMSPNTLVLPPAANALPADLRSAGIGFLGQAFALATSPSLPQGLLPLGQQIVYDRATILAQAGQRIGLQEPLETAARDLLLDWSGSEFARLSERFGTGQESLRLRAEQDFRGFDHLLRQSRRGHLFMDAVGAALGPGVQTAGLASFIESWARETVSRAPHISALVVPSSPASPIALQVIDPSARLLGPGADVAIHRGIPFGSFVPLSAAGSPTGQMAIIATPQIGAHEVVLSSVAAGVFDLGLVVPDGTAPRRLLYSGVSMNAGARARLVFTVGASGNTYALEIDDDGDGDFDRSVEPSASEAVAESGPRLISAVQVVTGRDDASQYGQLIALVFSEEIRRTSSQDGLDPELLTNYQVEANKVLGASLQPGGRVVLLSLRDGVGPFVSRTVTVSGIEDAIGHPMSPSPAVVTLISTIQAAGGRLAGRVLKGVGTPVPRASIRLLHTVFEREVTLSVKDAGADGEYTFDYVPAGGTHLEAVDPDTGERGDVRTTITHNGQVLDLDIILLGTGTVAGRALSPAGVPLRDAVVRAISLTRLGEIFAAVTDASGAFSLRGVPVGNFTLEAAHVATNARTVVASAIPVAGAVVIQDLTLVPLAQQAAQTGAVAGQVFRSDGTTPAVGISVYTTSGGLATTDSAGAYRIDLLPVGELSVRAIDQTRFEQATIVTTITAGATATANLRLFGGTANVSGVVLNADGEPVPGAQVYGGPTIQLTNGAGEFALAGVPLGQRAITAVHSGSGSTGSTTVALNVPGETAHVQVVLQARGSIAGQVFDADENPVAGLRVYLLGGINLATVTNETGGYRFDNILLGAYQVSAFRPDFSDGNIGSTRLSFRGEVRRTDVTFRGKGRVTGTVLNAAGTAALGASVGLSELRVRTGTLRHPANTNCFPDVQVGDVTVDLPDCEVVGLGFRFEPLTRIVNNDVETGTFAFDDVFVGSVTVEAASALSPTIVSTRGEIETSHQTIDLELRLTSTSTVGGTVFMPDGQLAGADVVVTLNGRNVVTDANGRFVHFEVPPGGFVLTASDPDTAFVGQSSGSVAPGVTADVPIRLLGKGSVSVEVRGANGVIQNARVRIRGGSFPRDEREAYTGSNGRVTFTGGDALSEGPFSASAFDQASGVTGIGSGTVVRDAQADLTIQLPDEAGTVEGRFLTVSEEPVANAQIKLSTVGGEAYATTLGDGSFRFEGVRIGNVTVEAFDPVTARRGRSTGAISSHGQVVTIDVHQIAQGTVRGAVRLSTDSSAVASADVTLSVNSVFNSQLRTTTALDGTFSFPGVSAGTFSISASDPATGLSGSASGSLTSEGEVVTLDVVLLVPARGRVEGHITTATAEAASGAQVSLGSRNTTADNAGFYFFDGVGMGPVAVQAMPLAGPDGGVATGSLVFAGEVLVLNVRFIGTGSVSGIVQSGGEVVPFATVSLASRNASGRGFSASTQTNTQGLFGFLSVPVGDVSVTAVQAVTGLAGSASGTIPVHGATLDLPVALQPSATVRARIVRETGNTPAAGMAVEVIGASRRYGTTSLEGVLQFPDLALGTYQIVVSDPAGDGLARATVLLDEGGELLDLGDLVLDESPPSVQTIAPADSAAQVPVTSLIVVTFSERMAATTITTSNLLVATTTGAVAGAWSLAADGRTATFTPAGPFADFSQVNVKVTTAVQDLVGKPPEQEFVSGFQTADSVPPSFASISPAAGAVGVVPASVVRVAYSEAINPAAFAGAAIEVRVGGALVAGQITPILNNTALVFTPASPLEANATYTVTVRPAADVFGNVQPLGSTFSFSTIDTLAPVILQLDADRTAAIEGSAVSVTANLGTATDVASVEFLVNGTVVRTDTSAPFDAAIQVTSALLPSFTISARATDQSGNIGSPASLTIAVETDAPPAVEILSPADGGLVNTGSTVGFRVRGTDDRGVSRIAYQTSGQLTLAGTFTVNPTELSSEVTFNIQIPATTSPGPLTLRAAVTDVAGVSSPTASIALTVADASLPAVQILSPAAAANVDAGQTVSVLVSAADNGTLASITLETTGATVFSATHQVSPAAASAQATFEIPIPIAPESTSLDISVRARDAAGNESTVAGRTYAVIVPDTTRPSLTSLVTTSGSTRVLAGGSALLRATIGDNVGVTAVAFETEGGFTSSGTVTLASPVAAGTADFSIDIPASTANGAFVTVRVRAADAANNLSDQSAIVLTVGDTEPPTVTVLSPAAGAQVNPGQTVTLTVRVGDDTAVRRVVFNATGVFTASSTREIEPPAATSDVSFATTLPASTPAGELVLTAEAIDLAGNSTTATRTILVADIVAPAPQVTSPEAGAAIDPRAPLSVTVNAADAVGVTQIDFSATGVASATESRSITPAAAAATQTFTVTFDASPPAGGSLTLSATARDAAGNVGTATPVIVSVLDVVAPTIGSIAPANGATAVDPQTAITIEFSEPMDAATLTAGNLSLARGGTSEPVTISVSPDGRAATLTPVNRPLALNTLFTLTISGSIADRAGHALGAERISTFRTVSPDSTPPRVQTTSPLGNSVGVALTVPIEVTFSEAIDPATVTPASFRVTSNSSPIAGAFAFVNGNTHVRFLASEPLPTEAVIVVELTSAVTDIAGNALANADGSPLTTPFTFTFVTGQFGITNPPVGADVVENSNLLIEARAGGSLGIASVAFTVNGQALPAVTSAPFVRMFPVGSAASTPTLTIVASARNAQGTEIASDTRLANVVIGLRVTPTLAGVPLDGSRNLRFSLSSAIADDLLIQLSAGDETLVSFPVNPVVLPAGQTAVDASVNGIANGNTAVFGHSTRGDTVTIVSVSPIVAGQTLTPVAEPVGVSLANPPTASTVVIPTDASPVLQLPGLVGWWRAEDNALDSAGANHGTLQNGATFGSGRFGQAFSFDGVDDQISVPHNANLNAGTAITISAWINAASMGHGRPIAQKRSSGNVGGYTFEATGPPYGANNGLQWIVWIGGGPNILQTPEGVVEPGVWHHVAATFDGATMRIFVDGAERASRVTPATVDVSNDPFVIGRNVVIPSFAWHGRLDEIEVYGRALSAAEIQTLFSGSVANQTRTVDILLLSTPAAASTEVSITSSNPDVATATSGPIAAGGQVAQVTIVTGQAGTATLIIRAGNEVRTITVIVGGSGAAVLPAIVASPVGVSLSNPPVVGQAVTSAGAQSALTIMLLSAPATSDTAVTVESTNPAVATASATAVASGSQLTIITIDAHANGTTTLILRAGGVVRAITVVVGTPAPGTTPAIVASPVGVSFQSLPSVGSVFAPLGSARTISLRLLAAPAASDTPVVVTSSDPTVAALAAPAVVSAGQQTADLTLSTGAGGRATLTIEVGGSRFDLHVVVGSDPTPSSPLVGASPVGISVIAAPSLGRIIAPADVGSAPTIVVPLLASPATAAMQVVVTTSNAAIAGVGIGPSVTLTIDPGTQVVNLPLSIPGIEGVAVLTFEFDGQRRELIVIVGNPPASQIPAITAPVVGVQVQP